MGISIIILLFGEIAGGYCFIRAVKASINTVYEVWFCENLFDGKSETSYYPPVLQSGIVSPSAFCSTTKRFCWITCFTSEPYFLLLDALLKCLLYNAFV
jgi:hypothetical protein